MTFPTTTAFVRNQFALLCNHHVGIYGAITHPKRGTESDMFEIYTIRLYGS